MGQSNMAGRAPLAGLPRFRNAGRIEMFRGGAWKPAAEPVGEEADDLVGPALAFADALVDLRPQPVGLVPCAKGGTKIDDWRADDAPASLFGACLAKLKAASARGRLAGILFYQGEYDTWRIEDAEAWPDKFKAMIETFRSRAGAADAPVVFTQIGPRPAAGDAPAVRLIALQGALRLRNGAMVSATDLPFQDDRLHLTQKGQLDLGRRYAGAMGRLLGHNDAKLRK